MRSGIAGVLVVGLAGCAGDTALRAQIAGAQIDLARARQEALSKPLVEITTPEGVKVIVRQPAGGGGADLMRFPDDPWAAFARDAVKTVGTIGGIFAGGWATREIVQGVGEFGAGLVQGLGNPQPNLTTIYRDNRYSSDDISGSFNPWSNSGRIDSPDATAPPLVVEQPRPVIVTQPAPVVVP